MAEGNSFQEQPTSNPSGKNEGALAAEKDNKKKPSDTGRVIPPGSSGQLPEPPKTPPPPPETGKLVPPTSPQTSDTAVVWGPGLGIPPEAGKKEEKLKEVIKPWRD